MWLYEVHVEVKPERLESYRSWLKPHIQTILIRPGFLKAEVWENRDPATDGWVQLSICYHVRTLNHLESYLQNDAPRLRQDAEQNFGGYFRARRRVLFLTSGPFLSIVGSQPTEEARVAPQVNWTKLMAELGKITDIDRLKTEVQRISKEIRKFDIHAHLSPTARERLKKVETKYQEVSKTLNRTQRQVDREFNRVLRNLKDQRSRAEKGLAVVKEAALEQKRKLEKASTDLKSRVFQTKRKKTKRKSAARKTP